MVPESLSLTLKISLPFLCKGKSLFAPRLTPDDRACLLSGWLFRVIVLLPLTRVQMLFNCVNIQNFAADQGHLEAKPSADRNIKAAFTQTAPFVLTTFYFSYHFKILK